MSGKYGWTFFASMLKAANITIILARSFSSSVVPLKTWNWSSFPAMMLLMETLDESLELLLLASDYSCSESESPAMLWFLRFKLL